MFAIPIFLVRPRDYGHERTLASADIAARSGSSGTPSRTPGEVPGLGRFLVGRFFYSDAVNTVIVVMSVVTTKALGSAIERRMSSCWA